MDYLRRLRQLRAVDQDDAVSLSVVTKTNASPTNNPSTLEPAGISEETLIRIVQPRRQPFTGWKVGATSAACIGFVTLIINIVALQWLRTHPNENTNLVEVYRGDCHQVERLQIWTHFGINAISTLLLSGSNYCMQVLCSPTRSELDRAHAKRRFLDIGVQSVRNLWRISPYRAAVWWILGLSSIPLHLMYNSAFYSSIGVSDYRTDFVTRDFESGEPFDVTNGVFHATKGDQCGDNTTCIAQVDDLLQRMRIETDPTRVERLDDHACLSAYANTLLTDRSNLILVTTNNSSENNLLADYYYSFGASIDLQLARYKPFHWICYSSDRMKAAYEEPNLHDTEKPPCEAWVSKIIDTPETWTPYDFTIDHCLSERIEERCSFNGNIAILVVVILFNIIKIACMLWVAFGLGPDVPLITIGDAIASYLHHPDPVTRGYCLWGRKHFVAAINSTLTGPHAPTTGFVSTRRGGSDPLPAKPASLRRHAYHHGATRARWGWTFALTSLALAIVLALFGAAYAQIQRHDTPVGALGFGRIHASALVNGWGVVFMDDTEKQIATAVVVANLPQTILSFLYLNLNGLVTSLALTSETLSYAHGLHKPLRVSLPDPTTQQRSTYFLQLPYRLSIPLIALSGVLHWLVSQSFFLAVVSSYGWDGALVDATAIATCGYSLVPMMAVLGIGVGGLVGLVVAGWVGRWEGGRRGMPVAGSCSLAVSALCHGVGEGAGVEEREVRWGVVPGEGDRGVGHCAFSSLEVGAMVEGKEYA